MIRVLFSSGTGNFTLTPPEWLLGPRPRYRSRGWGCWMPVLPPGTRRTYQRFSRCRNCGQVYWHGAHSKRLEQIIDSAVRAVSTGASE